jgi:uncharacterized protein with von Willebrand factor type A (vWA) domain
VKSSTSEVSKEEERQVRDQEDAENDNLKQFQSHSTDHIHSIQKIMNSFIEFEEVHIFGCQLLIYSGYYSEEKLNELRQAKMINSWNQLMGDVNIPLLKERLGLLSKKEKNGEEGKVEPEEEKEEDESEKQQQSEKEKEKDNSKDTESVASSEPSTKLLF